MRVRVSESDSETENESESESGGECRSSNWREASDADGEQVARFYSLVSINGKAQDLR